MERTEKIGLGIASAAHVLLFGLLSTTFLATPNPLKLNSPPIDVSMVDEVALHSMAPRISTEPPPPSEAPDKGPTEEAAPAPQPEPQEDVAPAPPPPKPAPPKKATEAEKPVPKPKPKPEPPKPAAPTKPREKPKTEKEKPATTTGKGKTDRPRGSLLGKDFLKGIQSEAPAKKAAATPPATSVGPAQKAALDAELRRQLKPYWQAPTGADAELLRTVVAVELNKDGSLAGTPEVIETNGQNASNRTLVQRHQENAVKAVRLAAPFKLPADLYDGWKSLRLTFDKRLSQ
ncbi:MAG: cell envelope biogenesis protein TolA [Sphingobium sp.]|nr:MAG: cell envelope biogenesis protein TolA [Sphingobium sp.]